MLTHFIIVAIGLIFASLSVSLPTEFDSALYNSLLKRVASPDNTCGDIYAGAHNGYSCDASTNTGGCCSQYGYCGNTTSMN